MATSHECAAATPQCMLELFRPPPTYGLASNAVSILEVSHVLWPYGEQSDQVLGSALHEQRFLTSYSVLMKVVKTEVS